MSASAQTTPPALNEPAPIAPVPSAPAPSVPVPAPAPAPSEPAPIAPAPLPDPESSAATSVPDTAAPAPVMPPAAAEEPAAPPVPVSTPSTLLPKPEATPAATDAVEVTVVGTRLSRTAGSAHVLRKKDLERFEFDDPHKILLSVPGVYIRGEDGMGLRPNISIRGADPDRSKKVTLLEDGILFGPAPYSAPAAYFFPIMTRMEKVRVIKGPGTISYGPQTVGGTIDLVTRSIPSRTAGGADVAVGQYGYGKAHVYGGSSTEQLGFLIEGVRLQNNGFKELPDGRDTGFTRNEWMVKTSYIVDPRAKVKNELRLKLTYSDEVSNESYLGITDADFRNDPDQRYFASQLDRMANHRTSAVLTHQLDISPKLSIVTHAYRHEFHRTWRKVNGLTGTDLFTALQNPNVETNRPYIALLKGTQDSLSMQDSIQIGPNQRDFLSQGVESRLRWDAETGPVSHRFEAGARYHYDTISRRHSQNAFLVADGQLVPDGGATEVTALNKAATHAVALHAVYAVTWENLTLTPGVRTELIRSSLADDLENTRNTRFAAVAVPGAGAFYAITDYVGVLAGVYQGFSPPPPGSAKSNKPEKSINYEGGARMTLGALRLEGVGFYNDYSNLTTTCTFSTSCVVQDLDKQFNLGAVRIYGLEVFGEHELPAGPVKIPLQLAYTLTRTEFLRAVQSEAPSIGNAKVGDEMPYIPRHQLRATAGVEHRLAGGNVAFTYVAETRENAGSGPIARALHTDEQFITDVSAFAKVWKTVSLYATLQNLFDSRYIVARRPFGARPNAPRWFQFGVKGSF